MKIVDLLLCLDCDEVTLFQQTVQPGRFHDKSCPACASKSLVWLKDYFPSMPEVRARFLKSQKRKGL